MKKMVIILLLLPLSILAQDNSSLNEKVRSLLGFTIPTVTTSELQGFQSARILDAREIDEFRVSHLPNAIYVGDKDFQLERLKGISKSDIIVVYCTVGYRSEKVAEKLKKQGYANVYNLFGGIFAWKNADNPVVDPSGKQTEKVHCYNESWSLLLLKGEKVY